VASQRFDVVILDLGLPDGSGWDLLPEVRERQPGARVVILSGMDISLEEACNVEAALLKSQISAQQLLEVINDRINLKAGETSNEHIVTHSVRGG
jgi:DNA-binding NarL/FixJ family response regulator